MTSLPPVSPRGADRLRPAVARRLRRLGDLVEHGRGPRAGDPGDETVTRRCLEPIPPVEPGGRGPRIVLLNDTRDQISVGSVALTEGLIAILRQRLPDATIAPIPSHWLIDTRHGLGAFVGGGAGMRQPKAAFPHLADQFETVADDWLAGAGGREAHRYLERFEGADLVILNGEGSLYRTNLSAYRELFLAWLARTHLGIPTVYLNGGLHLCGVMPMLVPMVRKTFPVLDAVAVREPASLRNLTEWVPGVEAALVPDAALAFTPDDARADDEVRALQRRLAGRPYYCFDPGAMPVDTRRGRRSALSSLVTALNEVTAQAVFVSHSPPDDYIAAVADEVGALYVDRVRNHQAFMALTAGAEFLVTGRHHNLLLAAIVGCPSVAFGSTTHKVHGACEWMDGLVGSPYDGTWLRPDVGSIAEQAAGYVARRDELREQLLEVTGRLRTGAARLGDIAAEVIERGASRPAAATDRTRR